MTLDPRRPDLFVIQATIPHPNREGSQLLSLSTPAAPFGRTPWQLALVAGYIGSLRKRGDEPTIESFQDYFVSRAASPVPAPAEPYLYTPWHDTQVTCLFDLAFHRHSFMQWPSISLAVLEQEAHCGRGSWSRLQRRRGALSVIAFAVEEMAAERDHLADQARSGRGDCGASLRELAGEVTDWMQQLHKAARADRTLGQAATVRDAIRSR
ncbi:hypothetical protein HUT19_41105 [Streptomyces sp. NA02950]|uniref:hypothetical protein n=1 Tax=Streptomyces sp. NA02950 TaxID=2742137 RepID=UPI0015924747|nr:hypothetical protein [Streptomyces sp. NA02950]QKV90385.1 hypothetical protein HUT19_00115 [Streptomyces sp. NA02950]QKV97282.1 hypothetical protein HUT19_41105 [Streptomyces sp. NA02950]